MKKVVKIVLISLAFIILLILLLPLIFKGKMIDYAKRQANNQLNATLTFTGGHLTLLKTFPLLTMKLDSMQIVGKEQFFDDTLIRTESLFLSFDLMSLFSEQYEIVRIGMENPFIKLVVDKNGEVNWDILREETTGEKGMQTVAAMEETTYYSLGLRKVELKNANLIYLDEDLDMLIQAGQMHLGFTGDLTEDRNELEFAANIKEFSIQYAGFPVLQKVKAELSSVIQADFITDKYTFSQSKVLLNKIPLTIEGYYAEPGDQVELDLQFTSGKSDFKQFLSVIPAIYTRDYDKVQASGNASIDGFIKGKYTDELLPAFGLKVDITGGMFQYPGLPANVSDITMNASFDNPGGTMDHTVVSVDPLHFVMAGNPVDASLIIRRPVSDPSFEAALKGKIDLGTIRSIYPLTSGHDYSGVLVADARIKGAVSDFENKDFANIVASGTFDAKNIRMNLSSSDQPLLIPEAHLELQPEQIRITGLAMNYGANDIRAEGYVENYIPYLLDGKTITGQFSTSSRSVDIDSLLADLSVSDTKAGQNISRDTSTAAFRVPSNIDFSLKASCDKLKYNAMSVDNAEGWIIIQNGEAKIKDLKMDLLGGSITLDGSYSTPEETRADIRIALKVNGFDVQQSYNALQLVKTFAPVAERTRGSYSAVFSFHSALNDKLRPVLSSMSGTGDLSSSKVVIEGIQVFDKIAGMLQIEKFKNATIDALNLSFEILDGKVHVRQFPFKMGSIGALLSGYTSLDQQISFILALEIPRTEFGTHFNDVVDQLAGKINKTGADLQIGDKVRVDVIIEGTVTKPTVTIGLKEAMENVVDELKSKVEEELQKKKEEAEALMKEEAAKYIAKIDAEARQLILEAEKQAEEIKSLARQSAQKIRQESDSTAIKLIEEGKKNGKLAEMAAIAAAGQLRQEADNKASLLVTEADRRADAIISAARQKADQMKQEAREKFNLSN